MSWRGLLALAVVVGLVGVSARGQTPLAWKFKKDDTFSYQTITATKTVMKLIDKDGKPEGKELVYEIEYDVKVTYRVLDTNADGGAVLEMKIEKMEFKNPAAFFGKPDEDDKVKGATFKITLKGTGEVTGIDGYEGFLKKLAADDGTALKRLQTLVSKESLTASARNAFGFLPEKPAKTWTRKFAMPLGAFGDLAITNTYRDEGSEQLDGKAVQKIGFDSAVIYSLPKAPSGDVRVEQRLSWGLWPISRLERTDKSRGTIYFDPAAGRLVAANYQITLKGKEMSLAIQGTKIDADIDHDQKTKTTLVK